MANETTIQQGRELRPQEKQALEREGMRPGLFFRPDVDIVEQQDAFVVTADLPGVDDRHVDVRLENGLLTIDATLAAEPDTAWTPLYAEYRLGGFQREFRLSEAIDAEQIGARMVDGVLEVRLPKRSQHRQRQIDVRAG
jgi:HSP20 family molecular chaperone IbpA